MAFLHLRMLRRDAGREGGQFAQPRKAPRGMALDGAHAAAQCLGDLRLGKVSPVPEHQHRPLPWRQLRHRPQQQVTVGYLTGPVVCRRDSIGCLQRPLAAAPQQPPPVDGGIDQDPPYISLRTPALGQQGPAAVTTFERDLEQVLSIGPVCPVNSKASLNRYAERLRTNSSKESSASPPTGASCRADLILLIRPAPCKG
jgi:hypothetical protein